LPEIKFSLPWLEYTGNFLFGIIEFMAKNQFVSSNQKRRITD